MLRFTRLAGYRRPAGSLRVYRARARRPRLTRMGADGRRLPYHARPPLHDSGFSGGGLSAPSTGFPVALTPAYTMAMPAGDRGGAGTDIVRFDAATGSRDVLVPASKLTPPGAGSHRDRRLRLVARWDSPPHVHEFTSGVETEHAGRLLGLRSQEPASCINWGVVPRPRR